VISSTAISIGSVAALAQCVEKAGSGTGGNDKSAQFQAWEAILQATDWSIWAAWMAGNQEPGTAPGYSVKELKIECKSGGLGRECMMRAILCKQ
jgi:hypothetical protein